MQNTLPEQLLTSTEKFAVKEGEKVPDWFMANRRYFISRATRNNDNKARLQKLYEIADELMDLNDYSKLINPLKAKKAEYQSMPATLRNYSIIKPVLDRFMGERRKRPNRFEVIPVGAEIQNEVKTKIEEEYKARLTKKFLQYLQGNGILLADMPPEQVEAAKQEIEKQVLMSVLEEKAIGGYQALEILNQDLRLEDKYQEGFYDYLVTGSVYDYKAIYYNNVEYCIVSPLEIDIIGWDETSKFAEDATAQVRTMQWSAASVIDFFRDKLDEDDIKYIKALEAREIGNGNTNSVNVGSFRQPNTTVRTPSGHYAQYEPGFLTVEHCCWKSLTKRGILTYMTLVGESTKPVDDTYVLDKEAGDISIEWTWENEWYETFSVCSGLNNRLDDSVKFLYWGVGQVQRTMLDNTSRCKLPYNGIRRGYRLNTIVSPVKTGIAYEELINSLHYRFDLALSRSYDKLMLFPIGLIPNIKGWDTERWMYSIRAFSIMFFDETSDKATQAIQAMKEIDMSMGQYMMEMWNLIQTIKQEYWEAVGFNPQRFGDVNSNGGKGVTSQAIYQSVSSTNDMIAIYEGFREKSLNALLDYSKFAWIEGKRGAYFNSDKQLVLAELDGIQHASTEYGIFCVNPMEEDEKIQFFKNNLLQPLAQNGNQPDLMAEILDTNNFSRLKELAKKSRQINEEFQMKMQEQGQQAQIQGAQMMAQTQANKDKVTLEVAKINAEAKIQSALIMADSFNAKEGDADGNGIDESDEIIDRYYDRLNGQRDAQRKQFNEDRKAAMEDKKMQQQNKKMANDLKIAQENKNKHDN
jgi:hypothetical protein